MATSPRVQPVDPKNVPIPETPKAAPTYRRGSTDVSMGAFDDPDATVTLTLGQMDDLFNKFVSNNQWLGAAARTRSLAQQLPPVEFHHFTHLAPESIEQNRPAPDGPGQYAKTMPEGFTQIVTADDIKAPFLNSSDTAKMKAFWLEWRRYEDAIQERFNQFGGQVAIQRRVLRYCVDNNTLRTMLRYRWGQGSRDLDSVPDDELYAFFKTDCERVKTNVADFFARPESARNHIIHAVRPEYLQSYLRQEINFSKKRYKRWDDFVGLLIDTFGAYTRFDNFKKPSAGTPPAGDTAPAVATKDKNKVHKNQGSKADVSGAKVPGGDATTKKASTGDSKPKHPCLKCKAVDHNVWKCPLISDNDAGVAEKKALLKTFYDQQRATTTTPPIPRNNMIQSAEGQVCSR
ncbi:hypothetical protein SPRG_16782 [Saprolegnia parasitica CBS 223.65]|uniref:Uncharacterized protein n=1 Tax=Saprolegnia parasitica (strain CBS 223.65) TaxID=695850 RepID=A0A067BM01_SAPPC|nr:hypothetical protein SPRG_16782 [Saprolegnia parasitica CBS 223.65]KDO17755.1 hypothetical protein SPRG_16782 [Saprolegnia parasitica CBS 223.65]|eukprot:XP_012211539.1 hypothetical protein SPRG_16782 [Saprolegnia parasitica CBS 223.65]